MASVIANDLDMFREDIRRMDEMIDKLEKKNQELFKEMEGLNAVWSGPAHDAYIAQFSADEQNITSMLDNLKTLRKTLNVALVDYTNCEKRVADAIAAIKV